MFTPTTTGDSRANSRKVNCWVTAAMATPRTAGATAAATLTWGVVGGAGGEATVKTGGSAIDVERGGLLNRTRPSPAGSTPAAASSDRRTVSTDDPITIIDPSGRGAAPVSGRPSTVVPLAEWRSSMVTLSGPGVRDRWTRETSGSSTRR